MPETIDRVGVRRLLIKQLQKRGFSEQTAAGADFTRAGRSIRGTDVNFSIGTLHGEVTLVVQRPGHSKQYVRITGERTYDLAVQRINDEINAANERGQTEGWLG